MKPIVTQITSVHPRYDTRIFVKQCQSLSKHYEVNLIVADGLGNEVNKGINIIDVGKPQNRIDRLTKTLKLVSEKALDNPSELYHLHDPELLLIAKSLQKRGSKVIFDAHEDVTEQIKSKPYLNLPILKLLSFTYVKLEKHLFKHIDAIIGATPIIEKKLQSIHKRVVNINNFPILEEFSQNNKDSIEKKRSLCYVGGLTKVRGIYEMVSAIEHLNNTRLTIAGQFSEPQFESTIKHLKGWRHVDYKGFVSRKKVAHIIQHSDIGLVLLHPIQNYLDAYPVKMFEYMAAGIPVLASNFPLWETIVLKHHCGLTVNPSSPKAIQEKIQAMLNNPNELRIMGENGLQAAKNIYNWKKEEGKLLTLYKNVINKL